MRAVAQAPAPPDAPDRPVPRSERRRAALGTLVSLLLAVATLLAWAPAPSAAAGRANAPTEAEDVTLLLFHGEGCPHCADERAWLEQLAPLYPQLRIELYEVWNDADNRVLLQAQAEQLGFEPSGVPVTIVGEQFWIGFSEPIAGQIEAAVQSGLASAGTAPSPGPSRPPAGPTASPGTPTPGAEAAGEQAVEIPLVGSVSLAGSSLVVSTLLIGLADGINPCSLWVLAVLLAMVLHSGSRGRVVLVGSTFLVVTAAMYGLYIAGMYSALDYAQGITWIRVVVAVVALAFGILQLKDGIAPGVGPSLSISPGRRPRLYGAMRGLAREDRGVWPTLAGTVVLAVGVSLLETPCTAGLPLLWTSLLADQQVALGAALALFALYMAVFLLDELALFGAAAVTMRARRLQPEQGRLLKIVSGSLLVTLAVTMIAAPEAMTGLTSSLLVFAVAGVLGLVVWLAVRNRAPGPARPRHR